MTWMLLFLYSPPEERTPANGGDGTVCGHRGSSGGRGGPPSAHSQYIQQLSSASNRWRRINASALSVTTVRTHKKGCASFGVVVYFARANSTN